LYDPGVIDGGRVVGLDAAVKDAQTVTSSGERVQDLLHGVRLRYARTHADARGDLCEIYDERWEFTTEPVPYVYFVTLHPGAVRGWVVHLEQADRLFFASGSFKVALYDAREDSPSAGELNVFHLGTNNRALLRIPPGVFHAVKNVGSGEAAFVNLPSQPYNHADPDKYRLPLETEEIPYRM
jgi:dTDP-4-dehydrorhamnose 3,5-epimerase